jgi:hypothetical protein
MDSYTKSLIIESYPGRELVLWIKTQLDETTYREAANLIFNLVQSRVEIILSEFIENNPDIAQQLHGLDEADQSEFLIKQFQIDDQKTTALKLVYESAMLDACDVVIAKYKLDLEK